MFKTSKLIFSVRFQILYIKVIYQMFGALLLLKSYYWASKQRRSYLEARNHKTLYPQTCCVGRSPVSGFVWYVRNTLNINYMCTYIHFYKAQKSLRTLGICWRYISMYSIFFGASLSLQHNKMRTDCYLYLHSKSLKNFVYLFS